MSDYETSDLDEDEETDEGWLQKLPSAAIC